MVSPLLLVAFQFQTWVIIWLSPSNWWTTENVWIDNWIESGRLVRHNLDNSVAFLIQCSVWLSQRRTISSLSHRIPAANVMECQNCCFVSGSGTSSCEILAAEYSWGIHGKACCCSWTGLHEISWINTVDDTNSKFTTKLKSSTLSVYESPGIPWLRTSVSMIFRVQCPSMSRFSHVLPEVRASLPSSPWAARMLWAPRPRSDRVTSHFVFESKVSFLQFSL